MSEQYYIFWCLLFIFFLMSLHFRLGAVFCHFFLTAELSTGLWKTPLQKHQEDGTFTLTVCGITMWETHSEPYQPNSFTVVAFPCMVGQVEFLMDWQHSCMPFMWSERRLMGQRALVRGGKWGERCLLNCPALPWAGRRTPLFLSAPSCFPPALSHFGERKK